jgi:predicted ABC-type ATPase
MNKLLIKLKNIRESLIKPILPVFDMDNDGDIDFEDVVIAFKNMQDTWENNVYLGIKGNKEKEYFETFEAYLERTQLNKGELDYVQVNKDLHNNMKIAEIDKKYKNLLTKDELKALKTYSIQYKKHKDSKGTFTNKKGIYTSERKKLHKKIVDKFLSLKTASKNPKVIFLAGVGGSGKSTLLKAKGYSKKDYVIVDADNIKTKLPEFNKYPSHSRAMMVHEESGDVAQEVLKYAILKKINLIVDGTMKNTATAKKTIRMAKKRGYTTELLATQLPTHKALERNNLRYLRGNEKDKRLVPPAIVKSMGTAVNKSIHTLKKDFDKYEIYNTDVKIGDDPILIERSEKKDSLKKLKTSKLKKRKVKN